MFYDFILTSMVFCFAGTIKGTVGIGLPTVSVAILSQFISPHEAVALVVFPLLVSNLWQVIRAKAGIGTLRKYAVLISIMVVTIWFATFITVAISPEKLLVAIGFAIVVFSVSSLARISLVLPDKFDRGGQAVAGFAAGIIGGLTSIWAPPIVTYLIARRTDNDEFVRAAGLFIFLGGIPLAFGFWQTGLLNGKTAQISALMVIPTLLGFLLGERIRGRMNPSVFRTVLLWIFLVMGLNLLWQAFL
jgi:uncharacterized membrane protein YfcA